VDVNSIVMPHGFDGRNKSFHVCGGIDLRPDSLLSQPGRYVSNGSIGAWQFAAKGEAWIIWEEICLFSH
jgi:hypothetical protein